MQALDQMKGRIEKLGGRLEGVILHHDQDSHHDHDSVYTSYAWLHRVLIEERARLSSCG